ncbi:sugar transferase [Pseudomonadota bacterium]|nr:sugar transferase [Pseudomonadota bacterium]
MLLKKLIKILRNIICLIGMLIVLPFLFLAALAIIIEDGLPIFFIQQRIGKDRRVFKIFKIRTLKTSTPHRGTHEVDKKYQLISGNWIRRVKLDEFPQLINVLKGDINLIGPRPGLPSQTELIKERFENKIFKVKPGITGLAQVMGYDMSDPAKLAEVDKIYIDSKSLQLDFLILSATFFKFPRIQLKKLIKL